MTAASGLLRQPGGVETVGVATEVANHDCLAGVEACRLAVTPHAWRAEQGDLNRHKRNDKPPQTSRNGYRMRTRERSEFAMRPSEGRMET